MRFAMYDDDQIGIVAQDDSVVDIGDLLSKYEPLWPADYLPDLATHFDEIEDELEKRSAVGGGVPVGEVQLHSPVYRPSKIVCLIGNYREGTDRPIQILDIFFKSPEAIIGDGDQVTLPAREHDIFHHEAELAVVIGKETSNVTREEAMDQILGYTVFNDVSARGGGRQGSASFLGKSYDSFAAFGPWIVTPDEIDDLYDMRVTVNDSGEIRQDYNTSDIERPIDELISYISSVTPLHPGDVICCGTNHQGLGAMQDGDIVTTSIDKIGGFTITVRDPYNRSWERGIDQGMAERVKAMAQNPDPNAEGKQA